MKSVFSKTFVFVTLVFCLMASVMACGKRVFSDTNPSFLPTTPEALYTTPPTYPRGLAQQGIEGNVTVEFSLDSNGKVIDPSIASSSRPEFEDAALDAIQKWVFDVSGLSESSLLERHVVRLDFTIEN